MTLLYGQAYLPGCIVTEDSSVMSEPYFVSNARQRVREIEEPPALTARLLLVDGDTDSADALGLLLELRGHDVRIADNAQTALQMIAEQQPDVVLVDIGWPSATGYEIAARLRNEATAEPLVLVAVIGYGQESTRVGFDHQLEKPIDQRQFNRILALLAKKSEINAV